MLTRTKKKKRKDKEKEKGKAKQGKLKGKKAGRLYEFQTEQTSEEEKLSRIQRGNA